MTFMNALWITRMSAYKHSPLSLTSAKRLIARKIERQQVLLKRYRGTPIMTNIEEAASLEAVFLEEARAARQFWIGFRTLLPAYPDFTARKPHADDVVNKLLDLGYHQLTGIVKKLLDEHDVSPALALMHVAHRSDSAPLAYDLVELFRADIVEREVLRFLRLKKKPLTILTPADIAHFLHEINECLDRQHYIAAFKGCQSYRYYMELQILRFISAINHAEAFDPLHLPSRHEGRCKRLTGKTPVLHCHQQVL